MRMTYTKKQPLVAESIRAKYNTTIELVEDIAQAAMAVWENIAADMFAGAGQDTVDQGTVIEVVIDCDRILEFGHLRTPEAKAFMARTKWTRERSECVRAILKELVFTDAEYYS